MKREDVFELLEPPPGGLRRLRTAMARPRRRALWLIPAMGLAAAAAVVAVMSSQEPELGLRAGGDPAGWALGLAKAPREPIVLMAEDDHTTAIVRAPTMDKRVVFYWVGTTGAQ